MSRHLTGKYLGIREQSVSKVIDQILDGFAFDQLELFQKSTTLPMDQIANWVRLPARTLHRRKISGKLLPDESERLFRASNIFEKTVDLFEGDKQAAIQWLETAQPALGGKPPLEFAQTEVGAREVEDLIGRLEHGVFT